MSKIFLASGISTTRTIIPTCLNPIYAEEPKTDYNSAKVEAKMVYGQVVEDVLRKTGGQGSGVMVEGLGLRARCSCGFREQVGRMQGLGVRGRWLSRNKADAEMCTDGWWRRC